MIFILNWQHNYHNKILTAKYKVKNKILKILNNKIKNFNNKFKQSMKLIMIYNHNKKNNSTYLMKKKIA